MSCRVDANVKFSFIKQWSFIFYGPNAIRVKIFLPRHDWRVLKILWYIKVTITRTFGWCCLFFYFFIKYKSFEMSNNV